MGNLAGVLQIDRRQPFPALRLFVSCRKLQEALLDVRIGLARKIPHDPCAVCPELIGQQAPNVRKQCSPGAQEGEARRSVADYYPVAPLLEPNVECDAEPGIYVGGRTEGTRGSSTAAPRTTVAPRERR
jgi:hypothetical protein